MRCRVIALFCLVLSAVALLAPMGAGAQDAQKDVKGLFLMTDYPAVSLRAGGTSSVTLRLQNYNLPPERLPSRWRACRRAGRRR